MTTPAIRPGLSVMMPAYNCARWMPAHLESMRPWLDLADEVIVVDSASTDGTLDLVRDGLPHPGLRIHQHPRGLYQSWNFGLQQVRTKYVYISTVGDSITRAGLEHLLGVAEQFGSDVVISKPHSIDEHDAPVADDGHWPLQRLFDTLNVKAPRPVSHLTILTFALLDIPSGILGSSASNLYRAAVVQRAGFPTGYGTTGDAAWAIDNAFACKFAVTPEMFSTFRHHPKAYAANVYAVPDLSERLYRAVLESLDKAYAQDAVVRAEVDRLGCRDFFRDFVTQRECSLRLAAARRSAFPWQLNPAAWLARAQRNRLRDTVHVQQARLLAELARS